MPHTLCQALARLLSLFLRPYTQACGVFLIFDSPGLQPSAILPPLRPVFIPQYSSQDLSTGRLRDNVNEGDFAYPLMTGLVLFDVLLDVSDEHVFIFF